MPMTINQWTWCCDEHIPSLPLAGKKVVDELLQQLQRHDWPEHDTFGIHLAIEEAVANAIKHGNQDDPEKAVHVEIFLSRDQLRIHVTDQGEGFDPNEVPDPTDDENLELPSGRGLLLMRSFMTTVEYNATGNGVVMTKQRS